MERNDAPTEKNTAILTLEPKLDAAKLEDLRARFDQFRANKVKHFILDLDYADYVNSSVLAYLVEVRKKCTNEGFEFSIINVSDRVRDILRTTKLDTYLLPAGKRED